LLLIQGQDGNTGLVEELVEHQYRSYVARLSRTFAAIPVSNIASNVGGNAEELTTYLETLIENGFLNARVERNDGAEVGAVLRFYLDPTQGPLAKSEKQQQQALLGQTERTNTLAGQVKDADYRLSITKEYVDYVKRQNKKVAGAGGNSADPMDVSWDDGDVDEDIMGDLR
jgi:COP9 signalosome complex subunit 3